MKVIGNIERLEKGILGFCYSEFQNSEESYDSAGQLRMKYPA